MAYATRFVGPIPSPIERLAAALAGRYRIEPELAAVLGAVRLMQEITTTAALQRPHILPLFDSRSAHLRRFTSRSPTWWSAASSLSSARAP